MPETVRDSVRERLRAATARSHAALEQDLGWEARVATLPGYRDLLVRLHGFHAGYEPVIGSALADECFFGPRRRLALLASDLRVLGLDAPDRRALPVLDPVPLAGPAGALGALYVLEGSTLGGQVIRRALERLHGPRVAGACAYYRGHGPATAALWRAFCERLEAGCPDEAARAAAVAAGEATFSELRAWLVRPAASDGLRAA